MANYGNKEPLPPDETRLKEDCFVPYKLRDYERRLKLQENICKMVSKATPIRTAFIANGVPEGTYYTWKKNYKEQLEEIKGTNYHTVLTEFFGAIYEADGSTEAKLGGVLFRKAIDEEDIDATKYLLDKRYKWKETKQVEVDTADDKVFELNIVPMEDRIEQDNEEED